MVRSSALIGVLVACMSVTGCATSAARQRSLPVAGVPSVPPLRLQIARAEGDGPGFLRFCPRRNGRHTARFDVTRPGGGIAPGWCRTVARRRSASDEVLFVLHWDARRWHAGTGSFSLRYRLPTDVAPGTTPVANLVQQTGTLPP